MDDFYRVIEEVLVYEGYELIFSGKGKIVARSDEGIRSIVIAGENILQEDLDELEDSEGDRVLVVFEDVSDSELEKVPDDVDIWEKDKLIRKIGEMKIEEITEERGRVGKDFEFEVEHESKEATLKPIMDFKDISELGERMVKGFKYKLELVPHYLFAYEVEVPGEGKKKGKLYINGISGRLNFWKKPFERVASIKRSHVKLEPNLSLEKSKEEAVKGVIQRYSYVTEKKREENGATIVEKEKKEPRREEIGLKGKGIVYVPMWAIEGTDGIVVINAARGKVVRETQS